MKVFWRMPVAVWVIVILIVSSMSEIRPQPVGSAKMVSPDTKALSSEGTPSGVHATVEAAGRSLIGRLLMDEEIPEADEGPSVCSSTFPKATLTV